MTAKYAVTDEHRLTLQKRVHELETRFFKGALDPVATINGLQKLAENRSEPTIQPLPVHVAHTSDPLDEFRGIDGLFVCGQMELDQLFRTEVNPLKLKPGWIPEIRVDKKTDVWIRSGIWRDDPEWNTRAILTLAPPRVGTYATHLIGQNILLGVGHNRVEPGIIRQDVFWSNFFVGQDYIWAEKSVTHHWRAVLLYERPLWATNEDWQIQRAIADNKGIKTASVALDVWGMNMVLACYGVCFRLKTYSRSDTIDGGHPLIVTGETKGVCLGRCWCTADAHPNIVLSVQGVPLFP